jgi:hypothetical protein
MVHIKPLVKNTDLGLLCVKFLIIKKENLTFLHYLDSKHSNIYKSELPKCFYEKD